MLEALKNISVKYGSDPLFIQGAGGNTSLKKDGVMWVKASGFWLAEAIEKNIFVPVDLATLHDAIAKGDPRADAAVDFVVQDLNPNGNRPSIETSVHAIFKQKYVVHTHCVRTIAYAIREDAKVQLSAKFEGLKWVFVLYARPGAPLAAEIAKAIDEDTNIVVLGNHGLIVAADSLDEIDVLMNIVVERLEVDNIAQFPPPSVPLENHAYQPPHDELAHLIAFDERYAGHENKVFYPDHLIFLGTKIDVCEALPEEVTTPMVIIPKHGVALARGANTSAHAMARAFSDVMSRVPSGAKLIALDDQQIGQLTNWDAEKYRQTLAASP